MVPPFASRTLVSTRRLRPSSSRTCITTRSSTIPFGSSTSDRLKIVAGRPYTGKDQLLKQNIVDKDEYAKIRPLIHAKQPKLIGGQGSSDAHTGPGPGSTAAPASGTAAAPKK